MVAGSDNMEGGRETRETGWEDGGGQRVLRGIPFCGRRFVIDGTRTVCHSLYGHKDNGIEAHQILFRGLLVEVDEGGLLA